MENNDIRPVHQCALCHKTFLDYDQLETHNQIHVKDGNTDDDLTDDIDRYCNVHFDAGDKKELNWCKWCGEKFENMIKFQKHCQKHFEEQSEAGSSHQCTVCTVCNSRFTVYKDFEIHICFRKPSKRKRPATCGLCSKTFEAKNHLLSHMRTHTGEKPFKCNSCGKCFSQTPNLLRHLKIHTGEKPYNCDVCHKSFADHSNLQKHAITHTTDRPFKCEICDKTFNRLDILQQHARIHTKEKPFKCDLCGESFRYKSNLQVHNRIHTGEDIFVCGVCDKPFGSSGDLQKHIITHTVRGKPFKCETCDKSFMSVNSLQKHNRIRHNRI